MIEKFQGINAHPLMKVFMVLLAASFLFLWGGQKGLQMLGASKHQTVATVNGEKITIKELKYELGRFLMGIEQQLGQKLTPEQAKEFKFDRLILDKLINKKLIEIEAKKMGIDVSDDFIRSNVRKQKVFQDEKGSFLSDNFKRFINNIGFRNAKEYAQYLKVELLKVRFFDSLTNQINLSKSIIPAIWKWNNQIRTFDCAVIDPNNLSVNDNPEQNELREYYANNSRFFIASKSVTFDTLVFEQPVVNIAQSEVEKWYKLNKNKKEYAKLSEKEIKSKIIEELETEKTQEIFSDKLEEISNAFEKENSLEKIAKNFKLTFKKYEKANLKSISSTEVKSLSGANNNSITTKEIDKDIVLFALSSEKQQLSIIKRSTIDPKKYFVIYVNDFVEPRQLSFAEAIDEVRKSYIKQQQFAKVQNLAQTMDMQLKEFKNLNTVAQLNKLEINSLKVNRFKILFPTNINVDNRYLNALFQLSKDAGFIMPYIDNKNRGKYLFITLVNITYDKQSYLENDESKKFADTLQKNIGEDVFEIYLNYLRGKYKIDINKTYFEN